MSDLRLRQARFAELSPFEVYGLCRLRVDIFVVEQECPYPELDGRDTEPGTVHLWFEEDGRPLATALLIAPAAQHRILFRQHDKEALLRRSNRSAVAGLFALGVAICAALLLVVDVLFSLTLAWVTSGALAVLLLWWWLAVPLWQRAHHDQDEVRDE